MKILLAAHHFPPARASGAELVAYRTARWLVEQGHQVRVVCAEDIGDASRNGDVSWSDGRFDGIPVRRLAFHLPMAPLALRAWFDHPALEAHFAEWIAQDQPDVVHLISGYLLGAAPLRAAQRLNVANVVTLTDFWFLCHTLQLLRGSGDLCSGPEPLACARCVYDGKRAFKWLDRRAPGLMNPFWKMSAHLPPLGDSFQLSEVMRMTAERRQLLRHTLASADAVIAPTRFIAEIHAGDGMTMKRCAIIPYSIGFENKGIREAPAHNKRLRIGYLGQVVPIKGVDVLVRAFRKLDRTQRPARLTIHGALDADPAYVHSLRALAGGDGGIVFADRYKHDDVLNILAELDVVVVPSVWYENAPQVILEAFAAGRPVIGTNLGGIAEVVQHEVNGLLFERGNADKLAEHLQRVLDEPELLSQLRLGIPPVRTTEQEMRQVLNVYREVLAERSVEPVGALV